MYPSYSPNLENMMISTQPVQESKIAKDDTGQCQCAYEHIVMLTSI